MDVSIIIDSINMKDLPEEITKFIHDNTDNKIKNLRAFYSVLLSYINEDVKNSYLNRILKYLSSSDDSVINIIDDFNEGVYDSELKSFSLCISNIIDSSINKNKLYNSLFKKVNFIFYNSNDFYEDITSAYNSKDYSLFIFYLLKHTFLNYKINIPGIAANRFYKESQTLLFSSDHRERMLKASAELGCDDAIIDYANILYKKDIDQSVLTLLKNKNSECCLWNIAYTLEKDYLKIETVNILKKELNYIFQNEDYIKRYSVIKNNCNEEYLLLACIIYNYIIEKYKFTKAYNSLGKLMIFNYILIDNNPEKTLQIAKENLKIAISMGNINAMVNLSIYYYENSLFDEEYSFDTVKKLFKVSADLGDVEASYYYGKILIDEGAYDDGVIYLNYAVDKKNKNACYYLGKYYDLTNDYKKSIEYYKQAIYLKYFDAAYYLALLYLKDDNSYVNKETAKNYLNEYLDKFSDKLKESAISLLNTLNG